MQQKKKKKEKEVKEKRKRGGEYVWHFFTLKERERIYVLPFFIVVPPFFVSRTPLQGILGRKLFIFNVVYYY